MLNEAVKPKISGQFTTSIQQVLSRDGKYLITFTHVTIIE